MQYSTSIQAHTVYMLSCDTNLQWHNMLMVMCETLLWCVWCTCMCVCIHMYVLSCLVPCAAPNTATREFNFDDSPAVGAMADQAAGILWWTQHHQPNLLPPTSSTHCAAGCQNIRSHFLASLMFHGTSGQGRQSRTNDTNGWPDLYDGHGPPITVALHASLANFSWRKQSRPSLPS